MVLCCVPKCCSRSDRNGNIDPISGSKITFHHFPKNELIAKAWLLGIKRRGKKPYQLWTASKASVVCSRHFLPTDFKTGFKTKMLWRHAIPSVFTEDPRIFLKKINPSETNSTSQNLPSSTAERGQTIIANGNKINQKSHPLDPKLVQVWSCSEVGKESKPTSAINGGTNNLPSFMKQALLEKEKIDSTYEGTSSADINNLMRNSQSENSNMSNIVKVEFDSSEEDNARTVPYLEPLDPNIPFDTSLCNNIQTIELPSTSKVMCDASTMTNRNDSVVYLQSEIEAWKNKITASRRRVKNLKAANGKLRKQISDMKHIVFCELQNRCYLSNNSDFNIDKQGCLLDRNSVTMVESSESEECEED